MSIDPVHARAEAPAGARTRGLRRVSLTILLLVLACPASCTCRRDDASRWAAEPDEVRGEAAFAYKPAPEGSSPFRSGEAVLSMFVDVDSFNPYTSTANPESRALHDLLFPHLALEQPDYDLGPPSFRPGLAERWTFAEDGRSIHFWLRDCRWSDGTPVTAGDVRFTWQAARSDDVAWINSAIVDSIEDVVAGGPRDLTVRFATDSPYLLMDVSDLHILPEHVFGRVPFARWRTHGLWLEEAKVSGGPWLLTAYARNQLVSFERNPLYWEEGKPYLERLHFRVIADTDAMLAALLNGEVDCLRVVPPEKAAEVRSAPHLSLYSFGSRSYGFIAWNNRRWPFDNPRVRRAMAHGIDRRNIVESLFHGHAKVAATHVLSTFWASHDGVEPLAHDPAAARTLLQEAGFYAGAGGVLARDGRPLAFRLLYNAGNTTRERLALEVQHRLGALGIAVTVDPVETKDLRSRLFERHDFDAVIAGANSATKVDLKPDYHTESIETGRNFMAYSNPEVDALIERARSMGDLEQAAALWARIQEILHEEQPVTMLYELRGLAGLHRRFQNVRVTSLSIYDNVHEWWVPEHLKARE